MALKIGINYLPPKNRHHPDNPLELGVFHSFSDNPTCLPCICINSSKPTTFPSGIVVKRAAFRTTYMAFSRWSKRRTRFKEFRLGDQIADERDRATPKGWNHLSVTTTCRFQPPFRIGLREKLHQKTHVFFKAWFLPSYFSIDPWINQRHGSAPSLRPAMAQFRNPGWSVPDLGWGWQPVDTTGR